MTAPRPVGRNTFPRRQAAHWVFASFVALGALAACSDEKEEPARGDPADCKLIANRCHKYDVGSGLAHDCHEIGHDGLSPVRCTELKPSCLAGCPETDGGSAGTSGNGGASGMQGVGGVAGTNAEDGSGGSMADSAGGAGGLGTGGSAGAGAGGTNAGGTSGIDAGGNECGVLGDLCHGIGPGFTEHCHEVGHDGNEPACEAEFEACVAACSDAGR